MLEYMFSEAVHVATSHQTMALLFLIILLEIPFVSESSAVLIQYQKMLGNSLVWTVLLLSPAMPFLKFPTHNLVNSKWKTQLVLKVP